MATAREARDWARTTLRGIGNSLYTPFSGVDGDDIDWDAYRTLGALLRRRTQPPHAVVHQRHRGVLVADDRRTKAIARDRNRGRAQSQSRCRRAGLHRSHGRQGLPRADPARAGGGRRHRLHPDADDGGSRGRRGAQLLPLHRRSHRYRARLVQLAVVGICPDTGRGCAYLRRDPRRLRDQGRRLPAREQSDTA